VISLLNAQYAAPQKRKYYVVKNTTSSGARSRVFRSKSADVSEEHIASLFTVEEHVTQNSQQEIRGKPKRLSPTLDV
jgi:hypothetical protein